MDKKPYLSPLRIKSFSTTNDYCICEEKNDVYKERKKLTSSLSPSSSFLPLSVRANRNDTYLSLSLAASLRLFLIGRAYFALLFMKSQRREQILKREHNQSRGE
jgi:hypothetical protein